MDFSLTDEQELLLESIDEFFERHPEFDEAYITEREARHEPLTEYRQAMLDAGFGLLGIPDEFGGTMVDTLTLCLVAERFNEHGFPSYFGQILQVNDILEFGTPDQQKATMESLMANKMFFSLGISEPGAGSDTNAVSTSFARRADGRVVVNGQKTFCTDGDRALNMLCLARDFSLDAPPSKSMSCFLIPTDSPGVTIEPLTKLGTNYRSIVEVFLDDVVVEPDALVGRETEGFLVIMKNFEIERLVIAADCLGMAVCAYNEALRYATQRTQFGKSIGSFQLVQEMLVEMRLRIDAMRSLVWKSAWEQDSGTSIRVSSALAKYYCSREAFHVIDDALQVLGGIGYVGGSRISRLWRDVRMNRLGGGTDQIMIHIAGRALQQELRQR